MSGAHTNPITTLAFALRGDCGWGHVVPYAAAQFAGATAAGALTVAILPLARESLKTSLAFGAWPAFWLEIVLTTILVLVNLSTAKQGRFIGPHSAIANGATTVFDRWISLPISGGSMNPARTLGPAIVAGGTGSWWVFTFAPLAGCMIAVALMWVIHGPPSRDEEEKSGE